MVGTATIGRPRGQRDRLRQAGGRAAADADQGVDVVLRGRVPGPVGHLDGHVHDHVVVAQRHREVRGDLVGQVHLGFGRDQHDPARAEGGDLVPRLAAASPEPKRTRCGRVSWTKRMSSIFRYRGGRRRRLCETARARRGAAVARCPRH